jgi:hypothetical protein
VVSILIKLAQAAKSTYVRGRVTGTTIGREVVSGYCLILFQLFLYMFFVCVICILQKEMCVSLPSSGQSPLYSF